MQKKWAKKPENWRVRPDPSIYRLPTGCLVMHPHVANVLRTTLKAMEE
jgi:hypothetical protein